MKNCTCGKWDCGDGDWCQKEKEKEDRCKGDGHNEKPIFAPVELPKNDSSDRRDGHA